ncbi:hypothetical protein BC628DRAFT_1307875 [Trametes gibbosa]|nr:hypothetical protein BC628DRAFT_1307875 [Trametes gibbosa]
MASTTSPLAERAEIHKSCKTLESVVNVLNDYCDAANAIVQLQKKLAKALREAATSKCVSEIPANALNASATIFESMSEVDAKFARYADKECDSVSAEVKKWFKKLAKEERTHDEKIASANQKIKQAGQIYERKAKKSPRDAAEEHTRYINLLSTLGPEVNREKYNHALLVTQRHSATMYTLAASFSRVADAEWARGCESVRRFSPTVGTLGQWKALCEGGWSGSLPPNLPDLNDAGEQDAPHSPSGTNDHDSGRPEEPARELAPPPSDKSAPQYSSRSASEQESSRAITPGQSPVPPPQYFPPAPSMDQRSMDDRSMKESAKESEEHKFVADVSERKNQTTLASLAAFPSPPTHYPLPPPSGSKFGAPAHALTLDTRSEISQMSQGSSGLAPFPRLTESPIPESASPPPLTDDDRSLPAPRTEFSTHPPRPTNPSQVTLPSNEKNEQDYVANDLQTTTQTPSTQAIPSTSANSSSALSQPVPPQLEKRALVPSSMSPAGRSAPAIAASQRGDYTDDLEFGVRRSPEATRSRAAEPSLPRVVERSDTGRSNSSGSVVAALRDRYARPDGPSSPPPRELPRLPNSVSSLAHRYEPTVGTPNSPPRPAVSPTHQGAQMSIDNYSRMPEPTSGVREPPPSSARYSVPLGPSTDEIALRRQRLEELEELELRERDLELRVKEREIEQRSRELERERQQLRNVRGARNDGYVSDSSRGAGAPRISTTQRPSIDMRYSSSHSQSSTNLAPPSQTSSTRQPSSQPSSPNRSSPTDHAPYCGCEACSASKYKTRDLLPRRDSRPTEPPLQLRPEKPRGGWIRRLSMPVVSNAFSLDSKKNASNAGIAGGPGYRNSLAFDEDGRLQTDLTGGIRNRSSTNVARR